jgi:predicted alpha/beta hydrolase family esterase
MWKLFIFTHGLHGNAQSVYIPSYRHQLEERGHQTMAPSYPEPDFPSYVDWRATFQRELAKKWNQESPIILIGHSAGGYFVLRLLGDSLGMPWVSKLGAVIVIAPASKKSVWGGEFYNEDINWANVRRIGVKLTHMFSTDDTMVPQDHQQYVIEKLGTMPGYILKKYENWGHFDSVDPKPVHDVIFAYV